MLKQRLGRRALLSGVALTGLGGLPLATVLADPRLARAAAESLDTVAITTNTGRQVRGALALPAATPAPAVLLIHEWWGLNDQIGTMAAAFAEAGFVALAADLYDGAVAETPAEAGALARGVDPEAARETLVAWGGWLGAHPRATRRLGTCGWCFGGGWSLEASLAMPVDATVIYYGRVPSDPGLLQTLQGPVLGHFATRDAFIDAAMVSGFEEAMAEAGKPLEIYRYEADHAFANPTSASYDSEDAALAWERTKAFLAKHLGSA